MILSSNKMSSPQRKTCDCHWIHHRCTVMTLAGTKLARCKNETWEFVQLCEISRIFLTFDIDKGAKGPKRGGSFWRYPCRKPEIEVADKKCSDCEVTEAYSEMMKEHITTILNRRNEFKSRDQELNQRHPWNMSRNHQLESSEFISWDEEPYPRLGLKTSPNHRREPLLFDFMDEEPNPRPPTRHPAQSEARNNSSRNAALMGASMMGAMGI